MQYSTQNPQIHQWASSEPSLPLNNYQPNMFYLPSGHPNFIQTGPAITTELTQTYGSGDKIEVIKRNKCTIPCTLVKDPIEADGRVCPKCGGRLGHKDRTQIVLKDIPLGLNVTELRVERVKYQCNNPQCNLTLLPAIDFKSENHRITLKLEKYIQDLLALGLTNKEVSQVTGVDKMIIKDIDKYMLLREFCDQDEDGNWNLKKPDHYCKHLGIDEFLLHHGHIYATIIIDLETGHILWIAKGKKKEVVFQFMEYVGDEWMKHVEAVACDMNSDFEEAFKDKYPHIEIVFDHFHIIKNFNDMVITPVRLDEYHRLLNEGLLDEADLLKGTKYILTSNRITLQEKDREVLSGKVLNKPSTIFNIEPYVRQGEFEARYNEIIAANALIATADIIKSQLDLAFKQTDPENMWIVLEDIAGICFGTGNNHFMKFGRLILSHIDGIVSFAQLHISTGKVEGTNQMIKTTRRSAYGYRDDEYFFLKCMKNSRRKITLQTKEAA